jgi:hypothetical protein
MVSKAPDLTEPHDSRSYAVIGLQNPDNFNDFLVALCGFMLRLAVQLNPHALSPGEIPWTEKSLS